MASKKHLAWNSTSGEAGASGKVYLLPRCCPDFFIVFSINVSMREQFEALDGPDGPHPGS